MTCCFLEGKGPVSEYDLESLYYLRKTYKDAVRDKKKDTLLCATHAEAVDTMIAELEKAGPKKYILDSSVKLQPKADTKQRAANEREPGEEG